MKEDNRSLSGIDGKVVYLAGPITGVSNYREQFRAVEMELLAIARVIINPAVLPGGLTHDAYMRICIPMLLEAEAVLFLPGWRDSRGAQIEFEHASGKGLHLFEILDLTFPMEVFKLWQPG
ncbi:DUF4406 domain-containing protein [Dickeya oryzae]|uniref:DUF4406 domain-containing protein n=1 Tax=Dickeya oryzae TaxID=1240404 RepID=A0ABS5B7M6_9GAMM|nr:DUF4406 domain-containing protein [Dickeya oryzae]MBP2856149.1 DUF4406 domain-containing protein [Dickeya oryzae]